MSKQSSSAMTAIKAFKKSKSPVDLQAALTQIENASFPSGKSTRALSPDEDVATTWLELLKATDSTLATLSKTRKVPLVRVSPPMNPGEPNPYTPGVAPDAIKDPELRRRYEAAIADNNKNLEVSRQFSQMTSLEMKATAEFDTWAGPRYKQNEAAKAGIVAKASSLSLTSDRMRKIRAAVGAADAKPK